MIKQKIMVSGIQPSNKLTLGNYLGAIKPFLNLQNKFKMFIFVADLHAITNDFIPNQLKQNRQDIVCFYYACGLNFKKAKIFYQSAIKSHNDLSHILLCHSTIGELKRMTQFKDKAIKKNNNNTELIHTGLLTYPLLMAADILIYDANAVIVGADQKQHLELTRDLANKMNKKYCLNNKKPLFTIPEPIILKVGARIMDLQNPTIKMSKSNLNPNGVIYLLDDSKTITEKILKAKTDSFNKIKYDKNNQPGISNLLEIYSSLTKLPIKEIEKKYQNVSNYAIFKKDLAKIICQEVTKIQKNFYFAKKNYQKKILPILNKNAIECSKIVNEKTTLIYKAIGLC